MTRQHGIAGIVVAAVRRQHLGALGVEHVTQHATSVAPLQPPERGDHLDGVRLVGQEGVVLLDPDAEQVAQLSRIAAQGHQVVLVHHAAEKGRHQGAAVPNIALEVGRHAGAHHVERRRDDQVVGREVRLGADHVRSDVLPPQRGIVLFHLRQVLEQDGRSRGVLERPPVLPVKQKRHAGALPRVEERVTQVDQLFAQGGHLAEHPCVLVAHVLDDGAVVLFRAASRAAQLEEHHRVGAMGDGLVAPEPHDAGALLRVVGLPVLRAGRLLHEHERLPVLEPTHQLVAHGHGAHVRAAGRIVVPRHHVEVGRPGVVVEGLEGAHEVGGHRNVRRGRLQDAILAEVALEDRVALKAVIVQQHRLVAAFAVLGRRLDLVPGGKGVPPEARVPGLVHRIEGAIARLEPRAERLGAQVAVAVVTVLVGHVPGDQGGMLAVALGQAPRHLLRESSIVGAVGAKVHATAMHATRPRDVHRQDVGIALGHPGRLRRGGRGQTGRDAVLGQQIEDAVEPVEIIAILRGLEPGPAEHRQRRDVDARQLEQAHVLAPHLLRPLIGVIVAAVPDRGQSWIEHTEPPSGVPAHGPLARHDSTRATG